jgi:RimJ/RimL family protein N-acetyltransferase
VDTRPKSAPAALPGSLAGDAPDAHSVCLATARTQDHGQIRQWLRDPDVQRWWGNAAAAEAEVALGLANADSICRMIVLGGTPIGYAQAVDTAHFTGLRPFAIVPGTYDCDLFIGVEALRGKGYGRRALDLLVEEVFATTLAVACSVIVSVRKEPAVRAYEQLGFRWKSVWDDPVAGASWVMIRDRPKA